MSKFNYSNEGINKTTNRSGHIAYKMTDKDNLVTKVLTSMFGEPKFYGSTDDEMIQLALKVLKKDPDFVAKLTCYARNVGNMRSVSHVLTALIAHEAKDYTRKVIKNVVVRPDDILEIMACYKQLFGKPFPNAMKREIAEVIKKFDEYGIAKYNGGNKSFKFKDVLRITHPVPQNENQSLLFKKILDDNLETPYTWETELSAKGNTKEVWEELISSGKVGYMALLRNLRNIIESGADVTPVLEKLADPEQVKKSKQLPFRFYSAYKMLKMEGLVNLKVRQALDKALTASIEQLPELKGRTLIAIDCSGSMSYSVSTKSIIKCSDIANVLGCIATRMCEDATVIFFNHNIYLQRYGKYDSILEAIDNVERPNGGTDMELPIRWALDEDTASRPFDRIIYLSDSECNRTGYVVERGVDEYRRKFNPDVWVHMIDLQGYGTQQFNGNKFNLITGWGDTVFEFIDLAEKGIDTLVSVIENYSLS